MTPTTNRKTTFTPRLEALEDRWCPACTLTYRDGLLSIVGDRAADVVTLRDTGSAVEVRCDGRLYTFAGVRGIDARLGDGDDRLSYLFDDPETYDDPEVMPAARSLRFDLGSGNDRLDFLFDDPDTLGPWDVIVNGGDGRDAIAVSVRNLHLAGGYGNPDEFNLVVNGGRDADVIDVAFMGTTVEGSARLSVAVNGGDGNDVLSVLWDNPELSTAVIDGGAGTDSATHSPGVRVLNVERDVLVRG